MLPKYDVPREPKECKTSEIRTNASAVHPLRGYSCRGAVHSGHRLGLFLMVRDLMGAVNDSMVTSTSTASHEGTGTAIFIFIIFGFVIASSWSMLRGKRWGRGAIVLVQFILAASSFQMMSGGSILLGIVTLASAVLTLFLIFVVKSSGEWFALNY